MSDGIIRIHGLADAMQGEMIELPGNRFALALNLERDSVGAVVMGPYANLAEGMKVKVPAVFWKCRSVVVCWAGWSTPWVSRSTVRVR